MPYVVINRNPGMQTVLRTARQVPTRRFAWSLRDGAEHVAPRVAEASGALQRRLRTFNCVYFDNRGVHRSSAPPGPYSTELMAKDALILAADVGWAAVSPRRRVDGRHDIAAHERHCSRARPLAHAHRHASGRRLSQRFADAFRHFQVSLASRRNRQARAHAESAASCSFRSTFSTPSIPADAQRVAPFRESIGEQFLKLHDEEPATPPSGTEAQTKAAISHTLDAAEALAIRNANIPVLILHGENRRAHQGLQRRRAPADARRQTGQVPESRARHQCAGRRTRSMLKSRLTFVPLTPPVRATKTPPQRPLPPPRARAPTSRVAPLSAKNGASTTLKIKTKRPSERQVSAQRKLNK
jgi:pimeloyl-ACP methyl ester carboxylesterase